MERYVKIWTETASKIEALLIIVDNFFSNRSFIIYCRKKNIWASIYCYIVCYWRLGTPLQRFKGKEAKTFWQHSPFSDFVPLNYETIVDIRDAKWFIYIRMPLCPSISIIQNIIDQPKKIGTKLWRLHF